MGKTLRPENAREAWTTGQIARFLGVDIKTVRRWLDSRAIPSWRASTTSSRLVSRWDLITFCKKSRMFGKLQRLMESGGAVLMVGCGPRIRNFLGEREGLEWHEDWFAAEHAAATGCPAGVVLDLSAGREKAVRFVLHLRTATTRPTVIALTYEDESSHPNGWLWDVQLEQPVNLDSLANAIALAVRK